MVSLAVQEQQNGKQRRRNCGNTTDAHQPGGQVRCVFVHRPRSAGVLRVPCHRVYSGFALLMISPSSLGSMLSSRLARRFNSSKVLTMVSVIRSWVSCE